MNFWQPHSTQGKLKILENCPLMAVCSDTLATSGKVALLDNSAAGQRLGKLLLLELSWRTIVLSPSGRLRKILPAWN